MNSLIKKSYLINWLKNKGGTVELQSKTIIPTTLQQLIEPDTGYDGLSQVTVNAIQLETKNITPTTSAQTIRPTPGKDGISQINVSAVDNTIDNNIVAR